jgi:hypothetical protein
LADGQPYALNLNQVGMIQVADGATFGLAGLLTTDQFHAFFRLPGVHINPTQDTTFFGGWLDNSAADNPVSRGTLAIDATTGPVVLDSGYIYQGRITTSGTNDLETTNDSGYLDGVELDGNLNVTGPFGVGDLRVVNGLTLNGTIVMPGNDGRLYMGYYDNAPETISGTGTIQMGTSQTGQSVLDNLSNTSLTIGPGITINAGAQFAFLVS